MTWDDHREAARKVRRVRARTELAKAYRGVTLQRPDLARAVGAGQRIEPLYGVVPYKEAFSPAVVRAVLQSSRREFRARSAAALDRYRSEP